MSKVNLAVIGSPIEHSLSPALHAAAYNQLGLDWSYQAFDVTDSNFPQFLSSLDSTYRGLSVTMPNKSAAFSVCEDTDFFSTVTQSTNTLLFQDSTNSDNHITGYNTDVYGIVHALRDVGVGHSHRVSVIGSGATAASAVVASAELGSEHVSVIARTPANAEHLRTVADEAGVSLSIHSFTEMSGVDPCDVAISTLPGTADCDLSDMSRKSHATLLDVAYSPWPSHNATEWNARGGEVVSGLRMLARQALIQVRIFVLSDPNQPLPQENRVYLKMCEAIALDPLV